MATEIDCQFESLTLGAILELDWARKLALVKQPLDEQKCEKVRAAIRDALNTAKGNPDASIRISFDLISEVVLADEILRALLPKMKEETGLRLLEAESSNLKFVLENGSIIYLTRKFQGDR